MSLDTGFIKNLNIILTMYGKIQIKDGIQDANEPGIKDVKVTLKR